MTDAGFARLRAYENALYHCATCNYCVSATWSERGIDGVCATLRGHSPAASYSGKGYLATARALLEGEADLAVHSLKDLPTVNPDGLTIGAFNGNQILGQLVGAQGIDFDARKGEGGWTFPT